MTKYQAMLDELTDLRDIGWQEGGFSLRQAEFLRELMDKVYAVEACDHEPTRPYISSEGARGRCKHCNVQIRLKWVPSGN